MRFIIAIDGPSGVGKGTLGRALAQKYNLLFLDTGLIFRYVADQLQKHNIPLEDRDAVVAAVQNFCIDDLGDENYLRSEEVGRAASVIGAYPQIRTLLIPLIRKMADRVQPPLIGAVVDGRDIGTTVYPKAPVKFFLQASPEVRAQRRLEDLKSRSISGTYEEILQDICARDNRDRSRAVSPLKPAPDAVLIDTSQMAIAEVIEMASGHVDEKLYHIRAGNA